MFGIMFWVILAAVAVVALASYLADCFYEVACEKGFENRKYYWIPFFLGLAGYLLVIALPDRKSECDALTQDGEY